MRLAGAAALVSLVAASSAGATSIARVTLPEMERASTVVFVGEFRAAQRASLGGLPGRRYFFRASRFFRGGPAKTVHLSTIDLPDLWLGVEPGVSYLVFAERRRFGDAREGRLTPMGYYQGVYRVVDEGRASNDSNGVVRLGSLSARLRR